MPAIDRTDVVALIADHAGLAPDRITDETRTLGDLGMDGAAVWNLFGALEERFGTGIGALDGNFGRYFVTKPLSAWNRLWALLGCAVVGGMVAAVFDRGLLVGLAIWAVLLAMVELVLRLLRPRTPPLLPIAVGDVVAAVEAGAWPEPVAH